MSDDVVGQALPNDYDSDPERFATNQVATSRFGARADIHVDVAQHFAEQGHRLVLDIGGGNGTLARLLAGHDISTVVVDRAYHLADAPRPAVRADAIHLPFPGNTFDGAAALWMLYHLPDPLLALREAHRILRAGGLLAVCAPSRYNDPELASLMPKWGRPLSFDAENGPTQLREVFDDVDVQRWDAPLVHIPDHRGLALYLRGRGLTKEQADTAASRWNPPVTVTKRGMIAWARKTTPSECLDEAELA